MADWARLLSECRGNSTAGSNPALPAEKTVSVETRSLLICLQDPLRGWYWLFGLRLFLRRFQSENNSISRPKSTLLVVIEYAANAIKNVTRITRRTFIIVVSRTTTDTICFLLESIVLFVAASCAARLRYILRWAASNSGGYFARIFPSCDNSLTTS